MKKLLIFVSVVVVVFTSGFVKYDPANNALLNRASLSADTAKLLFTVKAVGNNTVINSDSILIVLEFKNISNQSIKLPDIFGSLKEHIYLSVTTDIDREITPIKLAIADYSNISPTKYITIAPKRSYKQTVNLSSILALKKIVLKSGSYQIDGTYINNTGKDCVEGVFDSKLLSLNIIKAPISAEALSNKHPKVVKPNPIGTFTDKRDGQVYKWVKIGKQIWMAQNLNFKSEVGCSYHVDNDSTNANKYGMYYDFAALQDVCPKGWHVPSDKEWQQLEISAGIPADQVGKDGWEGDDISAFLPGGSTGFNVLLAGKHTNSRVTFFNERAYFWAAREKDNPNYIYRRIFIKSYNKLMRGNQGIAFSLSLRCVKDTPVTIQPVHKVVSLKDTAAAHVVNKETVYTVSTMHNDTSKMGFYAVQHIDKNAKSDDVLVDVGFKNKTDQPIMILDMFNDLRVNFTVFITTQTGKVIPPLNTDFSIKIIPKYITISPKETYTRTINLSEYLKAKSISLSSGSYKVKINYHNNIGTGAVKGYFQSKPILLTVINPSDTTGISNNEHD